MWKRPLLRSDIYLRTLVVTLLICFAVIIVENHVLDKVAFTAILIIAYILAASYWKNDNLPGKSRYNSKDLIEFHIGDICKGDMRKVGIYFIETIYVAQKEERNVVFSSWFFRESTINEVFGSAAIVYKPSIADKISGVIERNIRIRSKIRRIKKWKAEGKPIFKQRIRRKAKPIINCYIYADKVSEEMIRKIKRHFKVSDSMIIDHRE